MVEFYWIFRNEFHEPRKGSSRIRRLLDKHYALAFAQGERVFVFIDRLATWATEVVKLTPDKRKSLMSVLIHGLNRVVLHELAHIFSGEHGFVEKEKRAMRAVDALIGSWGIYEYMASFLLLGKYGMLRHLFQGLERQVKQLVLQHAEKPFVPLCDEHAEKITAEVTKRWVQRVLLGLPLPKVKSTNLDRLLDCNNFSFQAVFVYGHGHAHYIVTEYLKQLEKGAI